MPTALPRKIPAIPIVLLAMSIAVLLFPPAARAAGEEEALRLINSYRVENGRAGLVSDERLVRAAKFHAEAMIRDDFFDHRGKDGSTMNSRAVGADYHWRLLGENLAAGMSRPADAVRVWIDSAPHRRILLMKGAAHAGIIHMRAPSDGGNVVFGDYWVLLVAAPATPAR